MPQSTFTEADYRQFAKDHDVNFDAVGPVAEDVFLETLKAVVNNNDVPYPIPLEQRQPYIDQYQAGEPFSVGQFGGEKVQLNEFTCFQHYKQYSFEEHLSWACLVADQQKAKLKYACREYLQGEELFEIGPTQIPNYYLLNARIYQQTGWQLATVKEIIPAELFFTCHAHRFFPVTTFMRPLGVDYLEEPDIGHDIAGHVATFTIPAVANVMQFHGQARNIIYSERDQQLKGVTDQEEIDAINLHADELLRHAGRIYWFTVEFGLVLQDGEIRDFGAGILSSPGETEYSIHGHRSNRILIDPSLECDLLRIANTDYLISEFQKTYFVSESFDQLNSLTPDRIVTVCKKAIAMPDFTWTEVIPGDLVMQIGTVATSINEKYYRLIANQEQDECLHRTALSNLEKYDAGFDESLLNNFRVPPPAPPQIAIDWYKNKRGQV